MSLASFSALYRSRIDAELERQLATLPLTAPRLKQAMSHGLLLGGKRVRPFLVYAVGEMLGVPAALLDGPAAAVECIHAYSLIHDDLPAMDDDDLRRGQPTVHKAFDEATAILAGDALQTLAFTILADHPMGPELMANRVRMLSELARASGYAGMCGGQALDMEGERKQLGLSQLEAIHRHKTGALIRCAVTLGALCHADMDEATLRALRDYADAIGLAFQVQDDILDIVGDTATLGKRQGSDLAHEKSTYPALIGLEGARELARELHQRALTALRGLPYNTATLEAFADYIIERTH
ncbi:(2E,6E)-farnesyl diphosphate synthase [Aeromonas simiae]|uniref:(2E,6E)-farnesyl diphosphate synthase n=1 Tax=Aeromonas simiae TaxID=218936 RepID=UPI0005A5DD19|nr:(2E,6E)-farnesyl diphosphate synthase [Aeromonas simiae]MDO2947610.1 (2E,6E)-farnesyl diphosphate synthase [Aeromonas simiae]MDO2951230.1 (2E,6E)-farnesyl diphosphate synthase [Aeromonas simiae]MDO2955170.1 (2E,6E)-farnesyl diphosphate synthase [Aeromonas simiae]